MTNTIWYAEYDSSSFTFRAVGATEHEARLMLKAVAVRHSKQHGLDINAWFHPEDAWVLPFGENTVGYRDDYAFERTRVGKKV
jgi:hypothetical protein